MKLLTVKAVFGPELLEYISEHLFRIVFVELLIRKVNCHGFFVSRDLILKKPLVKYFVRKISQ